MDWQTSCRKIRTRSTYLYKTGKWADCHFLVGARNNQQLVAGHKFLLSMASPVFNAMFNGTFPEQTDPIRILDIEPETFSSLFE